MEGFNQAIKDWVDGKITYEEMLSKHPEQPMLIRIYRYFKNKIRGTK